MTTFGDDAGVAAGPAAAINPLRGIVSIVFGTGEVGIEEEGARVCVLEMMVLMEIKLLMKLLAIFLGREMLATNSKL